MFAIFFLIRDIPPHSTKPASSFNQTSLLLIQSGQSSLRRVTERSLQKHEQVVYSANLAFPVFPVRRPFFGDPSSQKYPGGLETVVKKQPFFRMRLKLVCSLRSVPACFPTPCVASQSQILIPDVKGHQTMTPISAKQDDEMRAWLGWTWTGPWSRHASKTICTLTRIHFSLLCLLARCANKNFIAWGSLSSMKLTCNFLGHKRLGIDFVVPKKCAQTRWNAIFCKERWHHNPTTPPQKHKMVPRFSVGWLAKIWTYSRHLSPNRPSAYFNCTELHANLWVLRGLFVFLHRTNAKPPHTQFHYHFVTQLRDSAAIASCANSCSKLTRTDRLIFSSRSHNPGHLRGKLGHPCLALSVIHSVAWSVQWWRGLNILQPQPGLIQYFASKTTTPSKGFLLVEGFHHPVLNFRGGSQFSSLGAGRSFLHSIPLLYWRPAWPTIGDPALWEFPLPAAVGTRRMWSRCFFQWQPGCGDDRGFLLEVVISLQWLSWLRRVAHVLAQDSADIWNFLQTAE